MRALLGMGAFARLRSEPVRGSGVQQHAVKHPGTDRRRGRRILGWALLLGGIALIGMAWA